MKCVRCGKNIQEKIGLGLPTCGECKKRLRAKGKRSVICPYDRVKMKRRLIEKIVLDQCPICKGIWLDSGELKFIKRIIDEGYHKKYLSGLSIGLAIQR